MTVTKKAVFIAAMLSAALVVGACRREVPEPNGLGAKDLAAAASVQK